MVYVRYRRSPANTGAKETEERLVLPVFLGAFANHISNPRGCQHPLGDPY